VSRSPRIALLEHDRHDTSEALLAALMREDADVELIRPNHFPDATFRLRKIGEAPGLVPGTIFALARGHYDFAHAFTAQDAVVAIAWSLFTRRPVVFTQREPLTRATVADRRLRLAQLELALERSDAVVAPDAVTADSLRRWMAVEPRVLAPDSGAEHLQLYAELGRR
jgi:glycosyl transferase family 4